MNCRENDLAMIVGPNANGKIFTVHDVFMLDTRFGPLATWRIEPPYRIGDGWQRHLFDKILRPIRDQPGDDEILRIAGKPVRKKESVK